MRYLRTINGRFYRNLAAMNNLFFQSIIFRRLLMSAAAVMVFVVGAAFFFPWDMLRSPINRFVSEQLGRRFEITQRLSVDLGRTTTVRLDGLEFANPDWASEPYLIKAKAVEFDIRLWPLMLGRVELPRLALFEPQVGLQIEPDRDR
jgi:AsmA family protein